MSFLGRNNLFNRLRKAAIHCLGGMDRYSIELPTKPAYEIVAGRLYPKIFQAGTIIDLRNASFLPDEILAGKTRLMGSIAYQVSHSDCIVVDEDRDSEPGKLILRGRLVVLVGDEFDKYLKHDRGEVVS